MSSHPVVAARRPCCVDHGSLLFEGHHHVPDAADRPERLPYGDRTAVRARHVGDGNLHRARRVFRGENGCDRSDRRTRAARARTATSQPPERNAERTLGGVALRTTARRSTGCHAFATIRPRRLPHPSRSLPPRRGILGCMHTLVRAFAIFCIFGFVSVAWLTLGAIMTKRSREQSQDVGERVTDLWGAPQVQRAPELTILRESAPETLVRWDATRIAVDLRLDQRMKGLRLVSRSTTSTSTPPGSTATRGSPPSGPFASSCRAGLESSTRSR